MRNKLLNYLIPMLITMSVYSFKNTDTANQSLTVSVKNIRNNKGQVGLCLFKSSEGFPKDPGKAVQCAFVKINANAAEYTFTNIPFGTYAVSVFHDENGDKKINTNFIGIPTEGVGASNNAKGSFGPPKFEDAKFIFSKPEQKIEISMTYL